jgi:hypothetical protein
MCIRPGLSKVAVVHVIALLHVLCLQEKLAKIREGGDEAGAEAEDEEDEE